MRGLAAVTLWLVLFSTSSLATTVIKLELKDMVDQAQAIVVGKCLDSHSAWNRDRSMIYTYTTFELSTQLKGRLPRQIVVKTPGGVIGNLAVEVAGAPRFKLGEEVILFLTEDLYGELRVVGFSQGRIRIVRDWKTGKAFVARTIEGAEHVGKEAAGRQEPRMVELDRFLIDLRRLIK